jgi:hypothetical protein
MLAVLPSMLWYNSRKKQVILFGAWAIENYLELAIAEDTALRILAMLTQSHCIHKYRADKNRSIAVSAVMERIRNLNEKIALCIISNRLRHGFQDRFVEVSSL